MADSAPPVTRRAEVGAAVVVDRVEVSVLSAPLAQPVPMAFGRLVARQTCLVRVSANGAEGIGESWINYPPWAPAERMATLCRGIAPLLIGMDVTDPATALDRLTAAMLPVARQAGGLGMMWQALSGVDLALWDLAGRIQGVPISTLLTNQREPPAQTAPRPHLPAYASGVGPTAVQQCCEQALALGLTAVKTKIGFERDLDVATLSAARSAIGPDRMLFADANQGWDLPTALARLPLLSDFDVRWLEEPLTEDRPRELEQLAAAGSPDIATGENVYGIDELRLYTASPAVRILQPDLAKSGGFTVGRQAAAAAAQTGTDVAPHCYSSAIGLAAAAQLGAAFPVVTWLELDIRDNPLRTDLLTEPLRLTDGAIIVPTGPGLGVDLDPETVRRFRTHHEEITHHDR